MRSIGVMLGTEKPKANNKLTKRTKIMLGEWAAKAHRLDASRPVSFYYQLFLDQLRKQYSASTKEAFFKHGVIE